jgi:hypothetical protein
METDVVCVTPPPLPVTVTEYVPVAVDVPTESVNVDEPPPGAAIDVGLNDAVVPLGTPEALSDTAALNPPLVVVLTVEVPAVPCVTEIDDGEAEIEKSGEPPPPTIACVTWQPPAVLLKSFD